ncbi:MAG: DUF3488 and transglutaminase-like domain-containing protein [Gammaproteobacteria bacterium]
MANARVQRLLNSPLAWTSAALIGGILLHIDKVPFWTSAAAFVCISWRLAAEVGLLGLPGRFAKVGVAIMLIAAIFARFQTLNGLSAGTALLVVMASIKLLETHTRRDRYVVLGATIFLLLAACLDRQSMMRVPLYLLHAWLCCTALATLAHETGSAMTNRIAGALAARSLLMALPLAVVLFLFFPRIVGAFWVLPRADAAVTGLSDTMSPGSISSLGESEDPAFRVRFEGTPPPPEERYWRGPVLHEFDGYTWRQSPSQFYPQPNLQPVSPPYRYRVTLEPNSQRWWFALDTVTASPNRHVMLTPDQQLIASEPVTRPTTYEAVSYTRTLTTGPLSRVAERLDKRLPPGRNRRSVELGQRMRAAVASDAEFVDSVLAMFRRGGFTYTLTPPLLSLDSVDDFLFNTKLGFCGHYASAFVTLMRAGGVPSRVVTGYQGGEWNSIREYFLVRQSAAHAWAEVWLDGRGWMRVDPTAVVAPERLRRGLADLMPSSLSETSLFLRDVPWLANMRLQWDAVNDWWNERVVRFDFDSQSDLLKWLGFNSPTWQTLGWLFAGGLSAWLAIVAWQIGRSLRLTPMDRLARAYVKLCAKLNRAGAPRQPHEGPIAYAATLAARRPDLAAVARSLLNRYADLRYGRPTTPDAPSSKIADFERAVSRLRVARSTKSTP